MTCGCTCVFTCPGESSEATTGPDTRRRHGSHRQGQQTSEWGALLAQVQLDGAVVSGHTVRGCWAVVQGSAGQVWLGSGSVLVLPPYQNDLVHPTLPLIFRRENVNHWLRSCVCAGESNVPVQG